LHRDGKNERVIEWVDERDDERLDERVSNKGVTRS
jgi:hypothetical protein